MLFKYFIFLFLLMGLNIAYAAGDKWESASAWSHTTHPPHDHPPHDPLKKLDEWMRNFRKKKETS
jgi:hypothetical protein